METNTRRKSLSLSLDRIKMSARHDGLVLLDPSELPGGHLDFLEEKGEILVSRAGRRPVGLFLALR